MADARPIGVFDSGVGGLTVLREIFRRSPSESTVYLGDNARAPYGVRSDAEVRRFSAEALDHLVGADVKAIVVACNTSTSIALADLRRHSDLPILGVVRPGATSAALATRNRRVGVIATPATIRSHAYFGAIKDENPAVEVYEHATPAFVPMVEAGQLDGPEVEAIVRQALAPLLGERETAAGERETAAGERDTDAGGDAADASPDSADAEAIFPLPPGERVDTILLGCTHYPLLRPVIARVAGERVALVDSATATAAALAELLAINGLETDPGTPPRHRVITTGDVARFEAVARLLFGDDLPRAVGVELAGRTAPAPALAAAG